MRSNNDLFYQAKSSAVLTNNKSLARSMSMVYLWMMLGIMTTAGIAIMTAMHTEFQQMIFSNKIFFYGLLIAQFGLVIAFSRIASQTNFITALCLYFGYAGLSGLTLSMIFWIFQLASIIQVFAATSAGFLGLSLFGIVTKRNLTAIGTFCLYGLFGMIGLLLLSIFIPSFRTEMANMVFSGMLVVVFAGLTAYDTQKIKYQLSMSNGSTTAIHGALTLYLDFINMFLNMLTLFGKRR